MNKIYLKLSVLFLAVAILFSCNSNTTNTNDDAVDSSNIGEKVEKMVYPIPTPFEISQLLQKSGASFILDLTNPTGNVSKYFTEKSKALNLGVYGADLSYTSTYNKPQETRNCLASAKKLTDDLGITTMVSKNMSDRVENNIDNQDSLYKIVTDSYYENFNFLTKNGKGHIAALILAGGWIEGLYISSQLGMTSQNNQEILKGIANQKNTVTTLIALLEEQKANADVAEVLAQIQKLKLVYDNLKIENDVPQITKEQFNQITKTVEEIRAAFIKA